MYALGASLRHVVKDSVRQGAVLAAFGGFVGMALAHGGGQALISLLPGSTAGVFLELTTDVRISLLVIGLIAAFVLVASLPMAYAASRVQPERALRADTQAVVSGGMSRLGHVMLFLQIALCLVLLVAAGLFVRTLRSLSVSEAGFDSEGVIVAEVNVGRAALDPDRRLGFQTELLETIRQHSGVRAAGGWRRTCRSAVE